MCDEQPPVPIPHNQFDPLHDGVEVPTPDYELWSNGHSMRGGPASIYSTMGHVNDVGQGSYIGNMGHGGLPPPVTVPVGHRRIPTHNGGYPIAIGNSQYTPSRLEYRAPSAPETNNTPTGRAPIIQHQVSGTSEGNRIPPRSSMSSAEDLKYLASQYLFRFGSHVDKLRVRRSRSGGFKVLILLEVEDEM